ncbi:MAG: ABC transporter permease [Chloroflexota bacterium]
MAAVTNVPALPLQRTRGTPWLGTAWRFARRKPLGAVGGLLLLLVMLTALLAPAIAPFDRLEFHPADVYTPPNRTYWMGTDNNGRDIFSRVVYGARISLQVGALTVLIGTTFGLVFGLLSGYVGGKLDFWGQRIVDSFQAFPSLFLALALTTALGRTVTNVGIALAVVTWPAASRVVRSAVLAQKQMTYVEAARALGANTPRILFLHLLPNVISVYIVLATAALAQAILVEASLSFLGVGVPPPEPSWGLMLLEAQTKAVRAPWMAIFPGLAITIAVFGFNLFGDALRDYLDPRLRRGR